MSDLSYSRDFVRDLKDERDALLAENQRLREALRFYAYNPQYAGDVAREALAGDGE